MGYVKRVLGMSLDFNLLASAKAAGGSTASAAGKASLAASPAAKPGTFAQLLNVTAQSGGTVKTAPVTNNRANFSPTFDATVSTIVTNTANQSVKAVAGKAGQEPASQDDQQLSAFTNIFQADSLRDTIIQLSANLAAPNPNAPVVIDTAFTQIDPAAFFFGDLLNGLTQNTALSGTPGIISGPVLGNLDSKAVVSPLPATTPGVPSGPVFGEVNLKTPVQPQLSSAPGTQSGPIIADVDPKAQISPLPATTPGVQSGPALGNLDSKAVVSPLPATTPGVQSGPVFGEVNLKTPIQPQPSSAPGVQSGPVLGGLDPKLVPLPQLARTPGIISGPIEQKASTQKALPPGVTRLYQAAFAQTKAGGAAANLRTVSDTATKKTGLKTGVQTNQNPASGNAGTKPGAATITANAQPNAQPGNSTLLSGQVEAAAADILSEPAKQNTALKPAGQNVARADNNLPDIRPNAQSDVQTLFVKPEALHTPNAGKSLQSPGHTQPRLNQASLAAFSASMAQRMQNGATKFEIRLDPAALGKVQVRLEVSADNRVEALVSTQRPEVLADLQRGADSLRRALNDAGFDLGSDGLNFSLDQGSGQPPAEQEPRSGSLQAYRDQPDEILENRNALVLAQSERGYGLTRIFTDRLDVRI
jgi:flagellar hook-length control protein FliK